MCVTAEFTTGSSEFGNIVQVLGCRIFQTCPEKLLSHHVCLAEDGFSCAYLK